MRNTLVINLFAGPGAGKSTLAALLYSRLKMQHVDCELVREFAKDKTWEKNWSALSDQLFVTAYQHYSQHMVQGQVDAIITDSPLLLGLFYHKEENARIKNAFYQLVKEIFNSQNNLNFFITRTKPYNQNGRNHTEEESKEIDEQIKRFLNENEIPYQEISAKEDSVEILLSQVLNKLALDQKTL